MKVVLLASGRGSNFCAIADAIKSGELPNCEILALVSNSQNAPVIAAAEQRNVPVYVVPAHSFKQNGKLDRARYEEEVHQLLLKLKPDMICLAGYRLILGAKFIAHWANRIINIHPSLLPAFTGLHAQKQALEYGVKWTGCTVHFVTEQLDAGPIIAQDVVEVLQDDTVETLTHRLLPVEHRTYIRALKQLSSD